MITGGVFWTKSELSLNKIRLRILNNPTRRFRSPPLSFGGQQTGKNSLVGMTPRPPFLFARLLFGFAKNFSEGDGLQNKGWGVGLVYILFIWLIIILAKSRLSIKYLSHLFDSFFFLPATKLYNLPFSKLFAILIKSGAGTNQR